MKAIFWSTEFIGNEEHVIPRFQRSWHTLDEKCKCNTETTKSIMVGRVVAVGTHIVIVHKRLNERPIK